ncbi:MAG: aspartate kinase, partial [Clostridia bacterium]|nr:aspartate kinase [Clostridia bacterium]
MLTKVVKFGGSSLADAEQFRRVASIIQSDPSRRFVVPSAPGKRHKNDTKVTDMLYHCYEMIRSHEDPAAIDAYYETICERYNSIIRDLGLNFDISGEL